MPSTALSAPFLGVGTASGSVVSSSGGGATSGEVHLERSGGYALGYVPGAALSALVLGMVLLFGTASDGMADSVLSDATSYL